MNLWQRLLLRGLRDHISEDSSVLALEVGESTALGPKHKVTAVLTTDALLLATPVRMKTVLVKIPRADIRTVRPVEPPVPAVVTLSYDDYERAIHRDVELDLSRHGDRAGIIEQLRATRLGGWFD
jgi:hypothetical protein